MRRLYILGLFFLFLLVLPIFLWFFESEKQVSIAIVDKTVPNETYREHLGLTWLLNHFRYSNAKNNIFNVSTDYYGFIPTKTKENERIGMLPTEYSKFDIIYLADTYGVYEDDLPSNENLRAGARSRKIYGGLEEVEWNAIIERLNQQKKSLLVAEFNTFASPTNAVVRKSVADYLGLNWSGWIGRYFNELDPKKNKEIPQWILDDFQDTWTYSGEGFILVNDFSYDIVVLEKGKHLEEGGISVSFTEKGRELFDLTSSPNYQYWFDIVTPKDETTVLANYEWNLTNKGKHLLAKNEIPVEFAAVLKNNVASSTSYYFAGDYNDVATVPKFYQIKGLDHVYKIVQRFSDDAFYWSTYIPMMKSIIEEFGQDVPLKKAGNINNTMQYHSRIMNDSFEVKVDGVWTTLVIKGVNIGMGKPGTFPGEAAITEDEYYRWFEQIGEMNANTIRVYTLHPPGFYNALKRYNDSHDNKIYVLHGIWINEEKLEESLDAFEEENLRDFQDEMRTIVDVIHGNRIVEARAGHASGVYQTDISEYVIGWILGIEWYPFMVQNTNEKHTIIGEYNGMYFETKQAQPFEYWLAQQMDVITKYEVDHYSQIRPMSFTNWVTTDILSHPSDLTESEDLVSVNPNVIYTKGEMKLTEQFASYHIYPYYPDFLNYDQKYSTYTDHRGQRNNYAGYLAELHGAHRLPILVAEFGVPSSRGLTHENPFGWNQGLLSETEQGVIVSRLFEDIMAEKLLGGLIFTWQDEWFKRTWNTMDYDNPTRRPYWSNAQTNEQQFGLLSFDRHKIQIDGVANDWKSIALYNKKVGDLNALYIDHDERYLYIRVDYDEKKQGYPWILLDVVPEQGNSFAVGNETVRFSNGVDFIVNLNEKDSRVLIDSYYDFFTYLYGHQLNLLKPEVSIPKQDSGHFSLIQYALNKEYYNPENDKLIPFSSYETGKLKEGNGNPIAKNYDSLADYHVENGMIELRIPWLLLQAKDPSRKEFIGDLYSGGLNASKIVEQIFVGALYFDDKGTIIDSFPLMNNNVLSKLKGYAWDNWDTPLYEERLKGSYRIVKELYSQH